MSGSTPTRVKVGVAGASLIAQLMHLQYLRELSDRFEISVLCDIAPENAAASAGSHAPTAIEAARAGLHVLVEKRWVSVAEIANAQGGP